MSGAHEQEPEFIPTNQLTPEEASKLRQAGLDLEQHEKIVSDILSRANSLGGNINDVNKLAIEEYEGGDDMEGLHPDVAQAIREEMAHEVVYTREQAAEAAKHIDEDDEDSPPHPDDVSLNDPESIAESVKALDALAQERLRQSRERYRSVITDEMRSAILEEVITGQPFTHTFHLLNGEISIQLRSVSTKHSQEITELQAEYVNGRRVLSEQYNAHYRMLRAAAQLQMVRVKDNIVFQQQPTSSVKELTELIYDKGPGRSELMRRLISRASQDFTGIMRAIIAEAGNEVFIEPEYDDIG